MYSTPTEAPKNAPGRSREALLNHGLVPLDALLDLVGMLSSVVEGDPDEPGVQIRFRAQAEWRGKG